ncbi:hypothetical protein SynMITS9220_02446 [Synechococcus sp. MIT S9220]|nr:hypothetical protein SynMITS9220_02446 [Synechococcus sp. MIT S9220]
MSLCSPKAVMPSLRREACGLGFAISDLCSSCALINQEIA